MSLADSEEEGLGLMLRIIFGKILTVFCLISIGFLSSCATTPAADESVVDDGISDDAAENEEDAGDSGDATDAVDGTDTTDGESDVTGDGVTDDSVTDDSATADESVDTSTADVSTTSSDANETTEPSTSSTSETDSASTTITSAVDTSTSTSSESSTSEVSSSTTEETASTTTPETTSTPTTETETTSTESTLTPTTETETTGTESTPTPTATACSFLDTYSSSTSGTNIGAGLPTAYEPSDAVWHSILDQLFIVSDEGWISMMDSDGSNITSWYIGGDLEGITVVDPDSSFIYIGVENPDGILEFNMDTETVTRTFTLTTWMTGADNQGLEALTFVPDASQTEGGQFYAGHQGEGSIYVFELPIATSTTSTSVTYVTSFTPVSGRTDIAGLSYNATDDVIYVAYDGANELSVIETDGTLVTEWTLPGNDQEGLAIDEDCHLYITEDDATHDVWVY